MVRVNITNQSFMCLRVQAVRQRMWPPEAAHPGFIGYLQKQYDHTQLEAIEVGGCFLLAALLCHILIALYTSSVE